MDDIEMNNKDGWNLSAYHAELMHIFGVFASICDRHGLRYYSSGGTTIGALRHKGFIPWDDDMDFEMPRKDFVQFLQFAEKELPPYMKVCRGGTEGGGIWGSKVVDTRRDVLERLVKETRLDLTEQPFIDVFYIDGVPDNVFAFRKWQRIRWMWRCCQMYRYPVTTHITPGRHALKSYIGRAVGFFFSLFFPATKSNAEMMRIQDDIALRWSFDECASVTEPAFFRGRVKRISPRYWYGEARIVPFETTMIRIPQYAEERCMMDHMDYQTLPPVEYRAPEHAMHRAYNHA